MPQLEPQQFYNKIEKAIESQSFDPIYFFYGDEPYLINQAVKYLKVCALAGGAADFNFSRYYSADVEVSRVRDEVETLPMMAARRVILLQEVQDLTDREWDELEPIIKSPVDSSVFILVGTKLDKRKKFFRQLNEASLSVEFKKPFENQVPGWISHICRAHELEISEEAILLLHRLVGSQLLEIETEVKKLKNFIGAGRTRVELEDVAQVVSARKEENVFALTESIAEGDRIKSLVRLVELLDNGQSEVGIVALIARHLRILLIIKQGLEQGLAGQRLAQLAQVPSYFLQDYVRQAKAWTYRRLESSLIVLAETDKALKSSPLSSHIWLENMVLKIASFQGMSKAESNSSTALI